MMTLGTFSQIDTQNDIYFSEEVAKFIIQDLLEGDIAKEEVKLLRVKGVLYLEKITLQDELIEDLKLQSILLKEKNLIQSNIVSNFTSQNNKLKKNLKSQKNKTKLLEIVGVGTLAAIVVGVLIISN